MNLTIVGTGYVGLVTGTCFAEMGNTVVCVDIDEHKVNQMRSGIIPIYEPDLENLFKRNVENGRLSFSTNLAEGIEGAEVIFLALPTPPGEDGSADLSFVLGVADQLGPLLKRYTVIVDKSTVPVGTAERVKESISKNTNIDFDVVSNPEFLREGFAVSDFMKPDRVVIGTVSSRAQKLLSELYKPIIGDGDKLIIMDERSAEMTKYAANAFLATKISFMNEVANLSEKLGADVDSVRLGIGSDERIGKRFLYPGIGYGGSCFPKDVSALHHTANEYDYDFKILEAVTEVNNLQKQLLADKVLKYFNGNIEGKTFALWGLAFKPNTDDVRESPAIEIIQKLTLFGAKVVAYDPEANRSFRKHYGNKEGLDYAENQYEALIDADALLIATDWQAFNGPNFEKMRGMLKRPVIFDGRNIYNQNLMERQGFHYESIGRQSVRMTDTDKSSLKNGSNHRLVSMTTSTEPKHKQKLSNLAQ